MTWRASGYGQGHLALDVKLGLEQGCVDLENYEMR
jgi:hypothetical protein